MDNYPARSAAALAEEQHEGVWLKDLPTGGSLTIKTKHTTYTLRKGLATYLLWGHPIYCPTAREARPRGSTWGGSMIKTGFVGKGMHFECWVEGAGVIMTSMIVEVTVNVND